ncbi:MAG: TIGR00289 family protein [Thermoplasmata archaeon]|nr:TIGR00289 family protein [Thermoplasmata archaeon]
MNVAALFSGGKDSTYAIYLAQQRGWTVGPLITMIPEHGESYMFHIPNIGLTGMLAEAMGLGHSEFTTAGKEEEELEDLKIALANRDVAGVLTGAIASDYQSTRIDRLCHELGMKSFSPLWRWNQRHVLEDMAAAGFKTIIVGVYAEGLDESWLGRELDEKALKELDNISEKYGINISGEGGEFETLVIDGPNFLKKLKIIKSKKHWEGVRGELIIEEARLVNK